MIKVEKGSVKIKGLKAEVKSEFCTLVSVLKDLHFDKEEVIDMVEKGFMSDEELHKMAQECAEELGDMLSNALMNVLKEGGEADE